MFPAGAWGLVSVTTIGGRGGVNVKNIAKTDVDMVADLHQQQVRRLVLQLGKKLYLRNPAELRKVEGASIEGRLQQLVALTQKSKYFVELQDSHRVGAMRLALLESY